jgi:uncharacterized membrane protein
MQQNGLNHEDTDDHVEDNPALSKVIERNIRTIINLRQKVARERSLQNRIADAITSFSGRMIFVYVHIVWFGVWILLNAERVVVRPFDPLPYGLLTMVVSLEAIFLSTFVLISQNRLAEEIEHRADLEAAKELE